MQRFESSRAHHSFRSDRTGGAAEVRARLMRPVVKHVALWALAIAISVAPRALMVPHALRAESFGKYLWAAEEIVSGRSLGERRLDFSPFYLDIHVAARRVFEDPRKALIIAQLALGAGASLLLYAAASA